MAKSDEVLDLTKIGDDAAQESTALKDLKRNLSHFRISAIKDAGPEIDFGDGVVLKFRPKVPATAMALLLSEANRVEGLRGYIRLCLKPESRDDFDELLDDIPLEGLNAIVEVISEASTSFPTK